MIFLTMEAGLEAAASLSAVKYAAWDHPGEHRLTVLVMGRAITLGPEWRYSGSDACVAALSEFGAVEVQDAAGGPGPPRSSPSPRPEGGPYG